MLDSHTVLCDNVPMAVMTYVCDGDVIVVMHAFTYCVLLQKGQYYFCVVELGIHVLLVVKMVYM